MFSATDVDRRRLSLVIVPRLVQTGMIAARAEPAPRSHGRYGNGKMRRIGIGMAAVVLAMAAACGSAQDMSLIPKLEKLASAGNAEALYHLGMAYHTGSVIGEDHQKALNAFRKATALGDPLGAYKLGCYYDGQGDDLVRPDAGLALTYKLVAAKAGYALAQQDVGVLYAQSGNMPVGLMWMEKSAALMTLASVYNGAAGIKPDGAKAAAYFQLFLTRKAGAAAQQRWLEAFRRTLSYAERARADEMVRRYRAAPSPLTIKALSGQEAARALIVGQ
ncbi:MAG TPA: hypothetical protein VF649_02160 [Sphingomonas sp.]|jgi:hypothetical protein|uniref:tetratricopeptide repeat protein n=1 Tax=Sphingomonas sp. TaxID=28214 RepID=UPI002ED87A9D